MMDTSPRFRRAPVVVGVLIAALTMLGTGRIASAHTDFESSVPTDGALVDGPLTEVVVNFTNPAQPSGTGFELLDPTGSIRTPTSVDETDGTSFVLIFEPALEAGTYGIRWKVQAGDAHPIEGAFRFEVIGTTTTTTTTTTTPTLAAAPLDSPATTVAPPATADATAAPEAATSLDEFLITESAGNDATAGRIGRTITILSMIFGVGVLAALIWTVRGEREEISTQLAWVRLAGLGVFAGGLIELAALADTDSAVTVGDLLATKPGLATALKMVGGLAVVFGFHERAGRIVAPAHSLSAAVATDALPDAPIGRRDVEHQREHRWRATSTATLGLVGYALVLVSFWFDGHTVSKGPWALHSLVNLVHLGAAAVWGGGVFAMTTVAWMRRRRSEGTGLVAMVVRFSSLATISLAAVIAAGLAMTWMILDSPGDLFNTQWGRILLAKTAVVAVAAGMGGYNHFRLRPALEQRPDDPTLAKELRVSLSVESVVFVAVTVLTAVLVASAT